MVVWPHLHRLFAAAQPIDGVTFIWTPLTECYKAPAIAALYDFKFGLLTDSRPSGAATAPIAACAVRSRFQQPWRIYRSLPARRCSSSISSTPCKRSIISAHNAGYIHIINDAPTRLSTELTWPALKESVHLILNWFQSTRGEFILRIKLLEAGRTSLDTYATSLILLPEMR